MKLRSLGNHDVQLSEIGYGAWAIGGGWGQQSDEESRYALHTALDAGINFIDTAEGYGNGRSEQVIARVLQERKQKEVFVATKTPPAAGPWPPSPYCRHQDRYSESYLRANVEQRLRSLNVECLDLLQLHTWTRAWNDNPQPLLTLKQLKAEGKLRYIGVSTPEQDQHCIMDLMRAGLVDCVQIIYNLFHQEPAAQLLPTAQALGVGVIVRVVFDEGVLTGKYAAEHRFAEDDFRAKYFEGDRMPRAAARLDDIRKDIADAGLTTKVSLADVAVLFALAHPAVTSVITGIRTADQARANAAISEMPRLPEDLMLQLRRHNWLRGVWYSGK